ncbi:MAG TPA: hypothetical protein VLV89_09855 [Candidatus Acidoferrum sp.]|nr:hypothetical protein [Candidatus Acidoferrum sp.]
MRKIRASAIATVLGAMIFGGLIAAPPLAHRLNAQTKPSGGEWQFTFSGDSRNCGDVVMPTIAADALKHHPAFYWHLGDFRATYNFDEDIAHQPEHLGHPLTISEYLSIEWQDFLDNQIAPFGDVQVFLGIGNHELAYPKTRDDYIAQFADWLDKPELRAQRLKDNPHDYKLHIYYHWHRGNVDFINVDNASEDQFDPAQLRWIERVLQRDTTDPEVATVVIGMHEALPDGISDDHSMSQSASGVESGRRVYQALLKVHDAHKHVYILASHSHFYMVNNFNTEYVRTHGGVLPGWVVGTAGAQRYALPASAKDATFAQTNIYGYMLATVHPDGTIQFDYQKLEETNVPVVIMNRYKPEFVHWCWVENTQAK